ncbi:MAG TPA: leucyl aminopeptidase [Gaiellales bacterium]|nr:leucyl aminopeptidase [Gaiellales bacterium]
MKISTSAAAAASANVDLLAVAVTKPVALEGAAAELDGALDGAISRLVKANEIRGAAGQVTVLHTQPGDGVRARRVAVVGLGSRERADAESVRNAAGAAVRALAAARGRTIGFVLDGLPLETDVAARCAVDGVVIGGYRFDRYKTRNRKDLPQPPSALTLISSDRSAGAAARRAGLVADAVNRARDLQHMPPNELGPEQLAQRAREIAAAHPTMRVEVWDERKIASRGMGAFAAVAQASSKPARLIVLRHTPQRASRAASGTVLGMIGKGLTYDSGGYSLKPPSAQIGMKTDMSGAAAVLEASGAIAELGLPLKFVTVVGATENMIDTNAFRVDDVLTAANGKTIEITNTDAEGRLVLADCLHHARSLGATHMVDLATLTGGVVVALGDYHAGLMGVDQPWLDRVRDAGERAGEHVWQLPLHDTYKRLFKSDIADMANSSSQRMALAPYAGQFLKEFAGDGPWAHLDIAGTADLSRSRGDYVGKGGTGYGVRLLVELAESLC